MIHTVLDQKSYKYTETRKYIRVDEYCGFNCEVSLSRPLNGLY